MIDVITPTEFNLLVTMMRARLRAGEPRQFLLEQCLPDRATRLERVVDAHIYNLREKLESAGRSDVLLNVRGDWVTGFVGRSGNNPRRFWRWLCPAHSHYHRL